jgi:hypothetical protein
LKLLNNGGYGHTCVYADEMIPPHAMFLLSTYLPQEQLPSLALGVVLRSLGRYFIPVFGQLPLVPVGLTAMN